MIAVVVGLLTDRAMNVAVNDSLKCGILFVEAYDLDLTKFARLLHSLPGKRVDCKRTARRLLLDQASK